MSAGWVAGSVRGRLLAKRRVGMGGARTAASAGDLQGALGELAASSYAQDLRPGMSVQEARRAVGSRCVWHLRVLAGWLPPRGAGAVRVFAGRFEAVNIADRAAAITGADVAAPYPLGGLAVAWTRAGQARTLDELRSVLASSAWGDPGPIDAAGLSAAMEARWAVWLADTVPRHPAWAAGAAALVAARPWSTGEPLPPAALGAVRRVLGRAWEGASDLGDFADRLPSAARWVLDGVERPGQLWSGEGRWWRRVDEDAAVVLRTARPGREAVAAAAARLVADAWRVQCALEAAGWGGSGLELFDALA